MRQRLWVCTIAMGLLLAACASEPSPSQPEAAATDNSTAAEAAPVYVDPWWGYYGPYSYPWYGPFGPYDDYGPSFASPYPYYPYYPYPGPYPGYPIVSPPVKPGPPPVTPPTHRPPHAPPRMPRSGPHPPSSGRTRPF